MVQTILNNFIFKSYSMEWQDYVFSGIAVALGYSLIPQIIKGFKEKKADITIQTSAITSAGMMVGAGTAYTLDLNLTGTLYLAISGLWGTLLYQSIKYRNNSLEDRMG